MNLPKVEDALNEVAKKYGYPMWGNVLHDLYDNNITPKHVWDLEGIAMKEYGEQLLRYAAEKARLNHRYDMVDKDSITDIIKELE